jgi:hypothetical protein
MIKCKGKIDVIRIAISYYGEMLRTKKKFDELTIENNELKEQLEALNIKLQYFESDGFGKIPGEEIKESESEEDFFIDTVPNNN